MIALFPALAVINQTGSTNFSRVRAYVRIIISYSRTRVLAYFFSFFFHPYPCSGMAKNHVFGLVVGDFAGRARAAYTYYDTHRLTVQ
jgi:hypothetical protein